MKASVKWLVAAATLVVGVAGAYAEDHKTYSAAECVSDSSNVKRTFSKVYNNSSTSEASVFCPIINDFSSQTIDSAKVTVFDDHNSEDICCTIRSGRSVGGSSMSWNSEKHCTSHKGLRELTYGAVAGAGHEYTYHMVCSIPPRDGGDESYVLLYEVD